MFSTLLLALLSPSYAVDASDWVNTRWMLSVESVLPVEVNLQAVNNQEFILKAIQIRSVVHCKEAEDAGKGIQARCTFEGVALQATPHRETPNAKDLEDSKAVLDDVVRRMTGSDLEVQLNKHGVVKRVDLLLPEGRNNRERDSREQIRQLVTDLAMGWSLRAPKEWKGSWQEANSPLVRAPAATNAGGVTTVVHVADSTSGRVVVQSHGSGIATLYYRPWEFEGGGKVNQSRASDTPVDGAGSSGGPGASVGGTKIGGGMVNGGATPSAYTPETTSYDVTMSSVAVVDNGQVVERVWSVVGAGTPNSIGSFQGVNLFYSGHLRQLSGDAKPDLGPTQMVSPPGTEIEGLTVWAALDS